METPLPLSGNSLREAISKPIVHTPIAEGLIYKGASVMFYAQPSVGKSTLSVQAGIELATGLPLFGKLHVPEPVRVWYIMTERSRIEPLERIQKMTRTMTNFNAENFYLDDEIQELNWLNQADFDKVIERGKLIKPHIVDEVRPRTDR